MRKVTGLRYRIIATGLLMVAAFTGSAAYDAWRLHQQVLSATDREIGNLSSALGDETARTLDAVDVLLRDTGAWYEREGSQLGGADIAAALKARTVGVAQVSVLSIVDAQGLQRYRSRDTGEPNSSVADRPYFTAQRDNLHAGMFISGPMITRTERLSGLVVSHRLNRADGSFDGVLTAIVTMQRLQGMFSAIQLGEGSALLLALDDGTLIVRQPFVPGTEGILKFPELVAMKGGALLDKMVSPMDGRVKFAASVGVGNRPLTLAITRDEEVALRPWYDALRGTAIRTVLLSLGVALTVIGLLRQLARQQASAEALQQSEQRYAMAMEAANEGHVEWNLASDSVFASEKWRALHGIGSQAEIIGSADIQRLVELHPDDDAMVRAAVANHLAGRTPAIEIDYRVRQPTGGWRWIHARGRGLRDDAGKPHRLFLAAVDVSQRKLAEADKAALENRLHQTQRLEALGTLAGGIAHDFNNILGAILGFGQMAQQQVAAGSAVARHIDRVLQAGGRARLLVRRILDFSGSGVTERVPVHIQSVLEEAIAMLSPSLGSGITMQAKLEAGAASVLGDATRLYQVAMNLMTNAAQAMEHKGVVTVALRQVQVQHHRSLLQGDIAPGLYARLDVTDTGCGIPPDVLARMFDPFFTTKKVGEGTGLGLSVVHGIVIDLGGAIDVESRPMAVAELSQGQRPGPGTRVSIWLPVVGDCEPPAREPIAQWPRGHGEIVMVVDDEEALVALAEELLAELGYEPIGFDSAEKALQAFASDPDRFDAVFTDETMPGLTGTELAVAVRAIRPELPVMLMSGHVGPELAQGARTAGVTELLRKPLNLADIAEALARAIRRA